MIYIYVVALAIFLVLAGFAVFHALKYQYVSPRVKVYVFVFVAVSAVLIALSLYYLAMI